MGQWEKMTQDNPTAPFELFGGAAGCGFAGLLDGGRGAGRVLLAVSVAVDGEFDAGGFDYGSHPVVAVRVDFDAVDLTLEAGESLAELFHGEDETDDGAVGAAEALAGHAHGDTGGIRDEHDGSDAAGHVGEADFFGFVAEELLVGLRWSEDRVEVLVAGLADEVGQVELHHGGVHLVRELFEGGVAITVGILGYELGEGLFEGSLGVVEAFELEEVFEEASPLAFGGADGEEDEDGVVAGAGDLDAAGVEELGEDGAGDAPVADLALGVDAGHEDGDLSGVEHAVTVGDVFVLEAVPVFAGLEGPGIGVFGEERVGGFFEDVQLAVRGVNDLIGLEEAEEPAFATFGGAEAVSDGGHGLAEADGILDGVVHERGAGGLVHHGRGHVERGDERVEGRGGAVHHERLVELVEVERGARTELDVDHRAHGEGREHLVRGLHGEDGWAIGHVVGNVHGEAAAVDFVELGVGVPGLVEVDAGDRLGELFDDAVDVVAEAVVGGVGDDGVGRVLVRDALGERALAR